MPIAHTHKNTTLRLVSCEREQLTHFYHWLPSSPQKAEGDGKGLNYSSYVERCYRLYLFHYSIELIQIVISLRY